MAGHLGEVGSGAHAPRHGFAMQEARVMGLRFEGVAERMAEIQDAPQIAFALIGGDHLGLHADGICDDAIDCASLARQHLRA